MRLIEMAAERVHRAHGLLPATIRKHVPGGRPASIDLAARFFADRDAFEARAEHDDFFAARYAKALYDTGLVRDAVALIRMADARDDEMKYKLRMAQYLYSFGDLSGAEEALGEYAAYRAARNDETHAEALAGLKPGEPAPTPPGPDTHVEIFRSRILSVRRGPEAAIEHLRSHGFAPDQTLGLAQHWLGLISETMAPPEEVFALAERLIAEYDHVGLRRQFVNYAVNANRGSAAFALLDDLLAKNPHDAGMFFRAIQLAWQHQNEDLLGRYVSLLAERNIFVPGLVAFCAERVSGSAHMQAYLDACREWALVRLRSPKFAKSKLSFFMGVCTLSAYVDEAELGLAMIDHPIQKYPFAPRPLLARADLRSLAGDYAGAERDYEAVFRRSPQLAGLYPGYFRTLNRRADADAKIETLLDARETHVAAYQRSAQSPSGRPYDIERFLARIRRGDWAGAIAARSGRRANLLMRHEAAKSYRTFSEDLFAPGRRYGKIGVIGWEGVSDEIRWAQNYSWLSDHSDDVVVSCEPRLHSIFARSFPKLVFTPIPRRFPVVKAAKPIIREEIRDHTFSGVIDGDFRRVLSSCDLTLFADELTYQIHAHGHAERIETARRRAYLAPDPELRDMWGRRLRKTGDGREIIGLIWSSMVKSQARDAHYLSLEDLAPLMDTGRRFVSLQPNLSEEEEALCASYGVEILDGADLYNDFETIAAVTAVLDGVMGASTLPFEMAGAVGTTTYMLAISPEGLYQRAGSDYEAGRDQFTRNGVVVAPPAAVFQQSREEIVREVVALARRRLVGPVSA